MSHVYRVRPFVQHYDWGKLGSESAVARLLGSEKIDESKPYAELWMGNHVNGPCFVSVSDGEVPIWEVLKSHDWSLLFLFKVLSVGKALSIQSHPDSELAVRLHAQFPKLYRDSNPKPELAIALTEFRALFGFRPVEEVAYLLNGLPVRELLGENVLENLRSKRDTESLRTAYSALMTADPVIVQKTVAAVVSLVCVTDMSPLSVALSLARNLDQQYPGGDVGVLSVFFLNIVDLKPGECLYMGPNVPHAYLSGDILECMTSSDNVIRGGLTPKFKDVPTLLSSLVYTSTDPSERLVPTFLREDHPCWSPPGVPFAVMKYQLDAGKAPFHIEGTSEPSVVLVTHGNGRIGNLHVHTGSVVLLPPNQRILVTGGEDGICVYQAFTP